MLLHFDGAAGHLLEAYLWAEESHHGTVTVCYIFISSP